mgnify:CR=1 FL=1
MSNLYEVTNWMRLILAFLIAPWMTPLVLFMIESISGRMILQLDFLVFFLYVGLIANVVTAIFGIPAYLLYRKLKWSNILLFVLGGGIIGYAVSIFFNVSQINFGGLFEPGRILFSSMGAYPLWLSG